VLEEKAVDVLGWKVIVFFKRIEKLAFDWKKLSYNDAIFIMLKNGDSK